MKRLFFTFISLVAFFIVNSQEVTINGNKFYLGENEIWFNGINTPWYLFDDFGRSDFDESWWEEEFAKYNENHINLARVWIHGSGEVSPDIDETGYVSGANDLFWEHMDFLMEIAHENQVYVMPALLSFDITKNTYTTYEYWRAWIQSEENVQSYIDNVLIPLVERYNDEPYLLGWEICNEPEWMFENDEHGPQSFDDVQRMHAMFAAAVHENSTKPVTTGSAAPKWNSPIYDSWGDNEGNMFSDEALSSAIDNENAFLDFYQYHWYPWQTEWMESPFTQTTEEYGVDDRPVIVGESEGNEVCDDFICMTVSEMYENAYLNGFDGVCAWKTPQNDGYGTFENIAVATNEFYENHPELVYPSDDTSSTEIRVTGVELSGCPIIELTEGSTFTLTATVLPTNATDQAVSWSSNDTDVATVDSDGNVTATGIGYAEIFVTTSDGGYQDSCSIAVLSGSTINNAPVAAVTVDVTSGSPGLTVTFSAEESTDADGDELTYSWSFGDGNTDSGITVSYTYDIVGTYEATVVVSDGELTDEASVTITISDGSTPCDDPSEISLPYVQNGEGTYCFFTSDDISYVNSWCTDAVLINNVDYTNTWSASMPDKIDGGYYISYTGAYSWSHFEAAALKDGQAVELSDITNVVIYPNPFKESINISIDNAENVKSVEIINKLGCVVDSYNSDITNLMIVGEDLMSGLYLIKINTTSGVKTFITSKY